LDSLGLSDIAPDSALADALDAAAVSRVILKVKGPNLEKLIVPYAFAHQASGHLLVDGRHPRHRRQHATTDVHASRSRIGTTTRHSRKRSSTTRSRRTSENRFDIDRLSPLFLRVYFSVYFLIGLGLIGLFPPFQSPDAFEHFDRAVGISQGQFVTSTIKGFSGSRLPIDVLDSEIPFSQIPFDPVQRVKRTEFRYGFAQVWNSPQTF